MAMQYSNKHKGVRRLMKEWSELKEENSPFYTASPLEEDLFKWHFTIRGQPDTDFAHGIYHGQIDFPPEYPFKPPHIRIFTPNGRFSENKKICLSISGHHPEMWQPAWSVRTALVALISFMPTKADGAVAAIEYPPEERRRLALLSREWTCPTCGSANATSLPEVGDSVEKVECDVAPPSPSKIYAPKGGGDGGEGEEAAGEGEGGAGGEGEYEGHVEGGAGTPQLSEGGANTLLQARSKDSHGVTQSGVPAQPSNSASTSTEARPRAPQSGEQRAVGLTQSEGGVFVEDALRTSTAIRRGAIRQEEEEEKFVCSLGRGQSSSVTEGRSTVPTAPPARGFGGEDVLLFAVIVLLLGLLLRRHVW